ncbi:MAG: acyl-CoA dehydrogenase family protein [Betaproteobacteria bacterium]|nr:acyl-CoA dehydrogenase family protein [Betaproteobacteria bacterium]
MFTSFSLAGIEMPEHLERLREDVRRFLRAEFAAGSYTRDPAGWDRYDAAFTRKIAAQGWIGMTWPRVYGGHERTSLERYVVTEELLAAGAPVRAHWLADRQFGPLLLAAGSEAQKRTYLPRIAAGECFVCVGMSESDSGSDLASIRTRATPTDGGWRISGRKVWTSYAHKAHLMNLFARTSPYDHDNRHAGVTQFIVDLDWPGITINPIINLAGDHDFNEVIFDDVLVPDDRVIGAVGSGWTQVSGELAHERAGSERWLNAYGVLVHLLDSAGPHPDRGALEQIGRLVTHLWTLHRMSFSLAGLLNQGVVPAVEAALVKDLGNQFDQDIPEAARRVVSAEARARLPAEDPFNAMLDRALLYAPSYPIRGGTREILRGIIARGLGLR